MSKISKVNITTEYLNFLRNSNILSVSDRGVTTTSETFTTTATGAETFTLAKATLKNIRSVVYDGTTLAYGSEYAINLDTYKVTISTVVPAKTVVISYDYGTDKIFSDYPRYDLTPASYPRIGFGVYGFGSETAGFGNVNRSDWRFDTRIYATSKSQADTLLDTLRGKIIDAQTTLYYCHYIKPTNVLDLGILELEKGKNKIFIIGLDVSCPLNYEIN